MTEPNAAGRVEAKLNHLEILKESAFGQLQSSFAHAHASAIRDELNLAKRHLAELESFAERGLLRKTTREPTPEGEFAETREPDEGKIAAGKERVRQAQGRYDRALRAHDEREAAWTAAAAVFESCQSYATANPQATEAKPCRPGKQTVDEVRAEIAALLSEIKSTSRARLPIEDVRASIADQVASLAKTPDLSPVFRGGRIRWPMMQSVGAGGAVRAVPDALAIVGFAFRGALTDALLAEAESLAAIDGGVVLSTRDRDTRLADLGEKVLAAERVEEAIVSASEDDDRPLQRRGDADPRAVLGVVGPEPTDD
jgi:hypothetical protein